MANTDREVSLRISTSTNGEDSLRTVADELRQLSTEGGAAAPRFEELANKLDELGNQQGLIDEFAKLKQRTVESEEALRGATTATAEASRALRDRQAALDSSASAESAATQRLTEAKARLSENRAALDAARKELAEYQAANKLAGGSIEGLTSAIAFAKDSVQQYREAVRESKSEVTTLSSEQRTAASAAREAAADVRTAARSFDDARLSASEAKSAYDDNSVSLQRLRTELTQAGIQTSALSAHDAQLRVSMQQLSAEAQQLKQELQAGARQSEAFGASLDSAFKSLGIRSVREVEAELARLQAAMAQVRNSNVIPADAERATAAFNARLAQLRAELSETAGTAPRAANGVREVGDSATIAAEKIASARTAVSAWVASVAGLAAAGGVAKNVIETGAAFETLEHRLTSLLGSADAAKTALADIKDLAASTPFEVNDLSEAFVKLTAMGLEPSRAQMLAMADTAANLGGGTESLQRVTLALGQAWSKSKLQGDEILQLAEAGVPVWDALSKATGKNAAELQKMSEAGQLGRAEILKLIDALGQMNMGASASLMDTFNGAVSNAKDSMHEFFDMVSKSGVLDYLTHQIQDLLVEFDRMKQTGELQAKAKAISDAFITLAEVVGSVIHVVSELSGALKILAELWVANKVVSYTAAIVDMAKAFGTAKVAAAELAATERGVSALGSASTAAAGATTALGGALGMAGRLVPQVAIAAAVVSLGDLVLGFLRAKAAAEEGDRAVKKMMEPTPINGPAKDLELVATNAELSRVKLTELFTKFSSGMSAGKTSADSLSEALKGIDFSSVKGVSDLNAGLNQIKGSARATADEIQGSLSQALSKLSSKDLSDFGKLAEISFGRGEISAQDLARTLDAQTTAALTKLGGQAAITADGMTGKFKEAAGSLDIVTRSYDRVAAAGGNAGAALRQSIEGALKAASNPKEFDLLAGAIRKSGESGRLSKAEVSDYLDTIKKKADEATPGINSMAEAFRALGMKSREELSSAAAKSKEAFDVIRSSGTASASELQQAFTRYAQDSIAANKGVASETLQAQAAMYQVQITADATGKSIVSAMGNGAQATDGLSTSLKKATAESDRLNSSMNNRPTKPVVLGAGTSLSGDGQQLDNMTTEQMKNAGWSARQIEDYQNKNSKAADGTVNRTVTTQGIDNRAEAIRLGLVGDQIDKYVAAFGDLLTKNIQQMNSRLAGLPLTAENYTQQWAGAYELAKKQAESIARNQVLTTPRAADKTVRVELVVGGKTVSVNTDESNADDLVKALQAAAARA